MMLEKLRLRLPDTGAKDEELLSALIEDAGKFICAFTLRDSVPSALEGAQVDIAAIMFSRMGMEGELSHGEGGMTRTIESLPEDIACRLRPWRLVRSMG